MYIHGYFYNKQDDKISVHILTHGDRSVEKVIGEEADGLFFTDDPVEITSEVNDTFDHLLCQQAAVRLLTKNFMPEFFCPSSRDAVINIYRGDECLFAGFIEPQTYSQGYNEELDEIELSCIDALTALEYAKYRDIGSLGILYGVVKSNAEQRVFIDVLREIMDGVTKDLDILNGNATPYLYDGSKAINSNSANKHSIFSQLSINELLFLGDEEDDVWSQSDVLTEMLKFLNLHIVQDGLKFYIFSWETVKSDENIYWRNLTDSVRTTIKRSSEDIRNEIVVDTDTQISVGEVYNKIMLTCSVESIENVIESPLDEDLLVSPFKNKQLYMTEYSSEGEGNTAIDAFDAMIRGNDTSYGASYRRDWYVQIKNNPMWAFFGKGKDNLMEKHCMDGMHQEQLPNLLREQPGACIMDFGSVEKKNDKSDNSPTSKVDMTSYFVVSVNGNGNDTETGCYPSESSLKANVPCAVYNGNTSGGVFSPSDDSTTNYIVLSGSVILNPVMALTDTYKALLTYTPSPGHGLMGVFLNGIRKWWHETVPDRNNSDGRYYTQRWWKAQIPGETPIWDGDRPQGFVPFTGDGPEQYEFNYSAVGNGGDLISKIGVLACMLIIGDKCVVETGTDGQTTDFEWRKYKSMEQCTTEDEYYQQSFTIGFDPKIGDKLVGTRFDFQNNISYELGIDAEGIAIPIRKGDRVSGAVKFIILGPVNVSWDVITRRHPTFFRHTKWSSSTIPLMSHVSSIMLEEFEVKIYSDNGLVNNTGDNDIIYMSDTKESFVNVKDDVEFKIHSALTSAENAALGVTDSVKMSTPLNKLTNQGVLTLYDYSRGVEAKAEQLYVDSYYNEYHEPRITMVQNLLDTGNVVSLFTHYRHPALNKTFFVQGIGRNLEEGYAEMTLKEIER